jgi:hypothetical protein
VSRWRRARDPRWVERGRNGQIKIDIDRNFRDSMRPLLDELRQMLIAGDHPGLRRLYPTAYPQHKDLEDGYRELVRDSLLAERLDAIEAMEKTLDATTLTDEQLQSWMHSINSVRLVLGTILDVSETDTMPDPTAPDAQQHLLYYVLGYLLEQIVDVMFDTVPEAGTED